MKARPSSGPSLPRRTETRASPNRLGRMVSRVPSALISISSCWRATNSASMAMWVSVLGASVSGLRSRN